MHNEELNDLQDIPRLRAYCYNGGSDETACLAHGCEKKKDENLKEKTTRNTSAYTGDNIKMDYK